MQLFTIGLNELQPDGTCASSTPPAAPSPTYDQETLSSASAAKVFTGWGFVAEHDQSPAISRRRRRARKLPPAAWCSSTCSHDGTARRPIVDRHRGSPPTRGGAKDLKDTARRPRQSRRTPAPFISRQLIQRLGHQQSESRLRLPRRVRCSRTTAPAPGAISAPWCARILTDYEARSSAVAAYRQLRQAGGAVLLRATALLRALNGGAAERSAAVRRATAQLRRPGEHRARRRSAQAPPDGRPRCSISSSPTTSCPAASAAAGLYAPEFRMLADTTALGRTQTSSGISSTPTRCATNQLDATVGVSLDSLLPLARIARCRWSPR